MKTQLLTLLLAGCLLAGAKAQTGWTPAEMMKFKRVSSPVVSEDGKLLAYVVASARMEGESSDFMSHIYVVSADGKTNTQYTFGDKSCTNPRFSPDGQYLSFTSGRGKDGKSQLYLLRLSGGEAQPLTAQKGSVGNYSWSPDSKRIAFTVMEPLDPSEEKGRKERKDWDVVDDFRNANLYTVSLTKDGKDQYPVKRLTKGNFHVSTLDWSPDSRTIVFTHQLKNWEDQWTTTDISVVSADSGAVRPLVTTKGGDDNPTYSPDGQSIAFVSTGDNLSWMVKAAVYVIPATGGTARKLVLTPNEEPNILGWTSDNRSVVVQEALGTRTGLYTLPASGGSLTKLPVPDKGITLASSLNNKGDLAYLYQSPESPAEVYTASLTNPTGGMPATADRPSRKLTDIHSDYTKGKTTTRTDLISWAAKDGKYTIEGLLTYPANYQPGRKYPLILNVHGGPAGVFTQTYTGASSPYPIQAFAQQGYFVLRANPRGSTGYGADFRWANFRDWGNNDYNDLMAGVDKVIGMNLAHPDSLVETGWSYGGYMTSMIITKTNRFKAVMAGAPVTNLMSFNGTADIPSFLPSYFGGEFWDDPKVYADHSAMFSIKNAKTPTLIIHGMADDRVPPEQGLQLHRALQRLGVPTQMITYPRQPHGFTEPKFIQDVGERVIEWFNRHLGRKTAAPFVTLRKE